MFAMIASELGSTGSFDTSRFQGLSAGKMLQPATLGPAPVPEYPPPVPPHPVAPLTPGAPPPPADGAPAPLFSSELHAVANSNTNTTHGEPQVRIVDLD